MSLSLAVQAIPRKIDGGRNLAYFYIHNGLVALGIRYEDGHKVATCSPLTHVDDKDIEAAAERVGVVLWEMLQGKVGKS